MGTDFFENFCQVSSDAVLSKKSKSKPQVPRAPQDVSRAARDGDVREAGLWPPLKRQRERGRERERETFIDNQ
jgi:hypothetical protein